MNANRELYIVGMGGFVPRLRTEGRNTTTESFVLSSLAIFPQRR